MISAGIDSSSPKTEDAPCVKMGCMALRTMARAAGAFHDAADIDLAIPSLYAEASSQTSDVDMRQPYP